MNKLLSAYRANPTLANARKIYAHGRKHPFSACLLSSPDTAIQLVALRHHHTGKQPSHQDYVDAGAV